MADEIYYVEKIVDRKLLKGKRYFYIKWQGYFANSNTWEPDDHLDESLIREFEEEYFGVKPVKKELIDPDSSEDELMVPLNEGPNEKSSKDVINEQKKELSDQEDFNKEISDKKYSSSENNDPKDSRDKNHSTAHTDRPDAYEKNNKNHNSSESKDPKETHEKNPHSSESKERKDFYEKKNKKHISSENKDRKESHEKKHSSGNKERNDFHEKKDKIHHSSGNKDRKDYYDKKHHSSGCNDRNDSYEKKDKKHHSYEKKERKGSSNDNENNVSSNDSEKTPESSTNKADMCKPGPSGYKKTDNVTMDKVNRDKVKRLDKNSKSKSKLTLRQILGFTDVDSKCHGVIEFTNGSIRRIPYQTVREKFPQGLIEYYEKNVIWPY